VHQPAAPCPAVLADQAEGRRLHLVRIDSQPFRDALRQHGLAGPEVAREKEDAVRRQLAGEDGTEGAGLGLGMGDPGSHEAVNSVSLENAAPSESTRSPAASAFSPVPRTARSPARPWR